MNKRKLTYFLACLAVILFISSVGIVLYADLFLDSTEINEPSGLLWQKSLENFATGLDASDERVYVIDISGTINCFDVKSGGNVWTETIGGYFDSGLVATSNMVYGGKGGTEVGAVDVNTGKFQWIVGSFWDSGWSKRPPSNIIVLDDRLYVTSDNFAVYNATTGELLWENMNNGFNLNSTVTEPAWILAWPFKGNRLFGVGGGYNVGRFIYRLDPDTGTVIWNKLCSFVLRESPTVYENQVIVRNMTDEQTTILSLDGNSGKLLWSYEVSAKVFQPTADDGLLFFGASDDSFYALNVDDGTLKWKSQVDSQNITALANDDNPLEGLPVKIDVKNQRIVGGFAVSSQIIVNETRVDDKYWGIICLLDLETGNVTWFKHFSGEGDISNDSHVYDFALTENSIYLTTINDLRIFSKPTGNLIESQNFEHSLNSPIEENGKVFIAADLWLIAYE